MRLASLVIALFLTTTAYADEPKQPEARNHYKVGAAAFANKDFVVASQELGAAYQIEPSAELLWSWAQAERLAGHCVTATGLYRKYAREAQKESQVETANAMIAQCEPETDTPSPVPWYKNTLGGALTATGVVGVTVGITFLALASSSHSGANQIIMDKGFLDDYEAKLDQTTTRRRIGAVSLGVGLAALGAGVTVYVLHDSKQRALTAGTDGRVVFVGARF